MSKKTLRPQPTPKKHTDSARFVVYELFMLRQSIRMPKNHGMFLRSLAFEGVVLHARVLRDFLYKKLNPKGKLIPPRDDDILAVDYFATDADWPYTYADMSKYLNDDKVRMDRALAHLSYDRLTYNGTGKSWDDEKIRDDIGGRWIEFIDKLEKANDPAVPFFHRWCRQYDVPTTAPF